jgi:hypothetical protein
MLLAIAPAVAAIVGITVFILLLLKNKDRITVPAELYESLISISFNSQPIMVRQSLSTALFFEKPLHPSLKSTQLCR